MMQKISMLWCRCIISSNIAIIIQKHQEVYDNTTEMNQLQIIIGNIVNFPGNSASFNFKLKLTGKIPAAGNTKDVKMTVPLKYFFENK